MNLYNELEKSVNEHKDNIAFIFADRTLKYSEIIPLTNILANFFLDRGLRTGDRCAILMRNSIEFVLSYFALVKIGVVVVPVNYLLKSNELNYIFKHSQVRGVITSSHFLGTVLDACEDVNSAEMMIVTGNEDEFNRKKLESASKKDFAYMDHIFENPRFKKDVGNFGSEPDSLAMLLYTSGTTGRPKGVMLSHRNLISNVISCKGAVKLSSNDRFICLLPMFHTFSWTVCVLLPLFIGAPVIIVESIRPFSQVIKAILLHRVNIFIAVPQIYTAVSKIPFKKFFKFMLPIRMCISGAAPLSKKAFERFREKFGLTIIEGYGLTEAAPVVAINPVQGEALAGSVGFPIPGVEVKLIDENGNKVVDPNFIGELCVKGDNVMIGYYIQPEETKECITEDKWLKTGDMGRIDEKGYIYIVDRKKDLIIVKGFNVYSQEVENVLKEHPDVEDAAVIGIPDEELDEIIKAYILPKNGTKPNSRELFKLCRDHLAVYKWPKEIIIKEDLPKSALGKILKNEIRNKIS